MIERPRILVVDPHPDDESFFWGGTIAKYAKMGAEIHLLVLSNGEKGKVSIAQDERGPIGIRQIEPSEERWLAEVRQQECLRVADILGVKREHVEFAGLPNLGINQNALRVIADSMKRVDPHVIISFDETGTSRPTNQDHSWAGIATFSAVRSLLEEIYGSLKLGSTQELPSAPQFSFRRLLTYNLPRASTYLQEYASLEIPTEELTLVDVRDLHQTKRQASFTHTSQTHLAHYFQSVGLLAVPFEAFYERISLAPSCRGKSDIFFGLDSPPSQMRTTIFPESSSRFCSTDPNFYQTIFEHCQAVVNNV